MKKLTLMSVLVMLCLLMKAQQPPEIKPLTIGDTVPDITITNVYNYPSSTIRLSDLKGKLVILDFMNTYCLSCIESLMRFDSLQHQYQNNLQIIVVTDESEERLKTFLKTNPIAKTISIPVVGGDTILKNLLPHRYVPHEVWFNKGVVKAITSAEYVTSENVNKILEGIEINWKIKNDNSQYNYRTGLLALNRDKEQYFNDNQKVSYSVFTPHLKDIMPRYSKSFDSSNNTTTISFVNFDIVSLYLYSQTEVTNFPVSHILLEPKDKHRLRYRDGVGYHDEWDEANTYCYEIKFDNKVSIELIKRKILNDLDFYLQTNGRIENRETNCLLLVRSSNSANNPVDKTDNTDRPDSINNSEMFSFFSANDLVASLNNINLFYSTPLFNGITDSKSLKITLTQNSLHDKAILEDVLKRQGFLLKPLTKRVDMLVITDNRPNN